MMQKLVPFAALVLNGIAASANRRRGAHRHYRHLTPPARFHYRFGLKDAHRLSEMPWW